MIVKNPETIMAQLQSIRAIMSFIINNYEKTQDVQAIQPNLTMVQTGLDYLRNAASVEVEVEDPNISFTLKTPDGTDVDFAVLSNSHAVITLENTNAVPVIQRTELFGEVEDAIDIAIVLPIVCGNTYTVKQINPMLKNYFGKDEFINVEDGEFFKKKSYKIDDEDVLDYAFLVGPGRNLITIEVEYPDGNVITFDINTHIHFKKDE